MDDRTRERAGNLSHREDPDELDRARDSPRNPRCFSRCSSEGLYSYTVIEILSNARDKFQAFYREAEEKVARFLFFIH